MEPTAPEPARPGPNPASETHDPRIATPVMDVVPPPVTPADPVATQPADTPVAEAPTAAPTNDSGVVPAPQESPDDLLASELQPKADAQPAAQPALPPKQVNPHTLPIIITVVIVLLLSILAVFAYMQSQK